MPSRTCRRCASTSRSPDEIAAAVAAVTQGGRGLWGLVNNAGVAVAGPFADLKDEDFDFVMNVNAYGPFRMTKAFLPLIAASKGRIVTISSISGSSRPPTSACTA